MYLHKLTQIHALGRRLFALLCLLISYSFSVCAQQPASRVDAVGEPPFAAAAPQSDLAKDNLNLVAATATQLKQVLIQDPGLMVELKRWMALDASNNGQMMNEENLTDDAVFDRLAKDIKFRSVATRLVQRYGYLLPSVNPGSELGKQQELLLKERVRRMVQVEAQEDEEAIKSTRQEPTSVQAKSKTCISNSSDCTQVSPSAPSPSFSIPQGSPDRDLPPAYPNDQQSLPASPRILQADRSEPDSPYEPSTSTGVYLRPTGTNSIHSQQTLNSSDQPQDFLHNSPSTRAQAYGSNGSEDSTLEVAMPSPTMTPAVSAIGYGVSEPTLVTDRQPSPPSVVRPPNPYSDIPSLYDLYVQAPAHDVPPQRFGLAVFHDGLRDPRSIPMDLPVGPDYVVGPGDTLNIDLWGGYSTKLVRVVDRQGRLSLPDAGPVPVSGRSLGEVQEAVQKVVTGLYRDTSADVSVGRLRTIRIYVVGDVADPGAYDISSLSTALNALVAAGGVTPKGSLRTLKHMRGRQEIEQIDAYDLLLHGVSPDAKKLENGDTLMVPPIGPEVTITGMVRRPSIYELNGETTVNDVLALAGGILPAAALKHVEVQRLEAHEKHTMMSLDLSPDGTPTPEIASFRVQDGDIIHIFPIAPYSQSTIYLQGHVLRPGRYSYRDGIKLNDLVTSYQDVLPEPAQYAEIVRLNPPDFHPSVVSFDLADALKNPATAPLLQPLDTVRIFSRFDFELPPTVSVSGEVRRPGTYRTSGQLTLRDAVFLAGGLTPDAALNTAQVFRFNTDGTSEIFTVKLRDALNGTAADNILLQPRDRLLIHANKSRLEPSFVEVTGAVAKPGRYPYTENIHAEDLIRAAGGLKDSADTTKADLTSYSEDGVPGTHVNIALASIANGEPVDDPSLRPGDVLTIRQKTGWKNIGASVSIDGEVMHPGTFGIEPGERLSSVLERAGGYTPQSYPYGAVLMRRDVRELETKNQNALIARMKAEREQLTLLPEGDTDQKNAKLNAIARTDAELSQLATNTPVGRVVIHIDNSVKEWKNTAADAVLRDGDVLVIPKKANAVIVNGQVFNPTAINAVPGRSAKWYLSQAGGLTPLADKKAVFVVRADGSVVSAKNNSEGWWEGNPLEAPLRPGDTVVVPEKTPKVGSPNWQLIMQSAQVAASVGLAIAYIHP
jgi:protein involved in polysaccharide export with SLBB domain